MFNLAKLRIHFTQCRRFLSVKKINIRCWIFAEETQRGRVVLSMWRFLLHKIRQLFNCLILHWGGFDSPSLPETIQSCPSLGSNYRYLIWEIRVFTSKYKSSCFDKQKPTLYPAWIWRTDNFCSHSRCPTSMPCAATKIKGSSLNFSSLLVTTTESKMKQK